MRATRRDIPTFAQTAGRPLILLLLLLLVLLLFSSVSTLQQVFLFSKEIQRHPDLSHFIPLLNCVSEIIPIKNNATI